MTLKSYLRMLLAAVTLLFVTSGCNDDDNKVGPPPSYTFSVAVSDVTETEATVTVTPSNDQATYYYAAVKKADFDAFESDAAYAQNILATLQAAADRKVLSLKEYLETALSKGSAPQKVTDLTAGTDYYAVALGMLTDGRFTSDLVKEAFKTDDAPEPALELSITMTPGYNGEGTDTRMSVNFKASGRPAVSGKYLLASTAAVEGIIAKGGSYDDIIDNENNGYAFAADELVELNSEEGTVGENWVWSKLTPGTSYTVIAKVKDADGNSVLKTAAESTAAAQGGGDGPELTLSMRAGDASGANTSSYVTCHIKSSGVASAKAAFLMKSAVDKALAEGKTLAEILAGVTTDPTLKTEQVEKINSADGYDLPCRGVPASTAVTAIISVTDANGNTTVDSASATTDAAQGGSDLTFSVAVTNIGAKGADIDITPSNSDNYFFDVYPASVVDEIPDDNQLIAAIIKANDGDVTKYLSSGPAGYTRELLEQYAPLDPATEYCVVVFGCDGTAGTTVATKQKFTTLAEGGGEPSDAYKAWLGTWTVTSTSSRATKKALTFDVTFKQKVVNSSYTVEGWTISIFRDQPEQSPYFPTATFEDGSFYFANAQTFGSFNMGDGYGTADLKYVVWFKLNNSYYYNDEAVVNGNTNVGMIGTMNEDKVSAVVEGTEGSFNLGGTTLKATMECMDFLYILDKTAADGTTIFGVKVGQGFTQNDYPIGPYTMVKKSSGSSVSSAPSSIAVHGSNITTYAYNLSSVLSAPVMSVANMRTPMLKTRKTMVNSLGFDYPAAAYEATISNSVNTEKSLGLKKHFIKK